jgi:quercetin dioxygenase-like cupin family protein
MTDYRQPQWAKVAEIPAHAPLPGIEMRAIGGEKVMLSFVDIAAGAHVPMHSHPHEQSGTVLEGSVLMVIGDETREIGPGDTYVVPPHVPHGTVPTDRAARVLDAFAPPREEYLRRQQARGH